MNILWFTWKDMKHPEKGGAELVTAEITKRLVQDGHQVKIITAGHSQVKSLPRRTLSRRMTVMTWGP